MAAASEGGREPVQLAHVDVDPGVLRSSGGELWPLVGDQGDVDVRAPAEYLAALPHDGWRVVHKSGRTTTLAAPLDPGGNTWAVVNLGGRAGRRILSVDPGPVHVVPGLPVRRRHLTLTWPQATAPAGEPPAVSVMLRNESEHEWRYPVEDGTYVRAWLLAPNGGLVQDSPSFGFSTPPALPALEPFGSVALPVTWATADWSQVPAGRHRVRASLVSLGLRSADDVLTLT